MRKIMKTVLARAVMAIAALFVVMSFAFAQGEVKKSPFGVGPSPSSSAAQSATPAGAAPGITGTSGVWGWLIATQQYYQREMASSVRNLKTANPWAAAASLAFISFMYGVLHAAGPGHGKAIISSYVLANRQTMRRGILLSFMAAFFQACSAILLVGILALAVKATSLQMKSAEAAIETASWAMVVGVGAWLLYRQVKPILAARRASAAQKPADIRSEPSAPVSLGGVRRTMGAVSGVTMAPGVAATTGHVHGPGCNHDHDHDHDVSDSGHVHDANCAHVHMPEPSQLVGPWRWGHAIWLAMTVGIRPCTGAILVMLFALSQGLLWAGIAATFMMSFGTALTVSALAALAVGSRDLAVRWAGAESPWAGRVEMLAGVVGALAVILLGTAGFVASLQGPAPF